MRGLCNEQKEIITWRNVDMAILGNIVFWLMILFAIVGLSFQAGRETGASEEAKRHNRIIWQDSKDYQWWHK